ncbi:MAG TPA: DUF1800 domain-containing protein [Gemmataceae bacterium]|nr:DUF1800 domain-containing protein [Gemmataceae bacterium]
MGTTARSPETEGHWAPYEPDDKAPWNLRRVVHLHRRAGFAATWGEIQRDLKDGPKASLDRVLAGKSAVEGVPKEFQKIANLLGESADPSGDPGRLKAWWVYRMIYGPDPLGERLTLLWHNHFATSNVKVEDLGAMRRQNELFRKYARAPFADMLNAAFRDPALLIWLDAPANRKGHPNENLGRELMELFTLGVGHYTEEDVKEAARALTGWTVVEDKFEEAPARHDAGLKTILGRRGPWKASDLVRMLLEHPATADRLTMRICELFMGEGAVRPEEVAALAAGLREHQLDVNWAVEKVLRSQAFFAEGNLGSRVQGPIEYVVGAARALELFDPPSSTLVLAEWTTRLGQDLFYPPNVGGWTQGRAWLTTRALIGRANYAAALIEGKQVGRDLALDPVALAQRHKQAANRDSVLNFYLSLLLGTELSSAWRERLAGTLDSKTWPDSVALRRALALILATPEAQLA